MANEKDLVLHKEHPIWEALTEIQKPRSRFQLEKFVIGQHDTAEQQYRQCLLEIQSLIYTIREVQLQLKKSQVQIDKLKLTNDLEDSIEAEIKELGMEQTNLIMIGAERELADLLEIWEAFPHKFKHEEIENTQFAYWKARLTRQVELEALGTGGSVGWSNLDSLRQINELTPLLETKKTTRLESDEIRNLEN